MLTIANKQDARCELRVTGRPDIRVVAGEIGSFTGYNAIRMLTITGTNVGSAPTEINDGHALRIEIPEGYRTVVGALPDGCTSNATERLVSCLLNQDGALAQAPAPGGEGGSKTFAVPIQVVSAAPETNATINTGVHTGSSFNANRYTATLSSTSFAPVQKSTSPVTYYDDSTNFGGGSTGATQDAVVGAPIILTPGNQTTVQVRATNNSNMPATLVGWIDLDGDGIFTNNERVIVNVPAGSGTRIYPMTFPDGSPVGPTTQARFVIHSGTVNNPQPSQTVNGDSEDYEVRVQRVTFVKTVAVTGSTHWFTITAHNTGSENLTGVLLTDDLTEVINKATWGNNLEQSSGSASYSAPNITWTGNLTAGQTATITYSVVDASVLDSATPFYNSITSDSPGSNCSAASNKIDQRCYTVSPSPNISLEKVRVGTGQVVPGSVVTYQVTIQNTGGAVANGVSVGDNLSGVLDDAVYNNNAAVGGDGEGSVAAVPSGNPTHIVWTGNLAGNTSETFTYSVTVRDVHSLGDAVLKNSLVGPSCPSPACTTETPIAAWAVALSNNIGVGSSVHPGDTVTYTLRMYNRGAVALTGRTTTINLANVLNNATWGGFVGGSNGAVRAGNTLTWSGDLAVGEMVEVVYRVAVNADAEDDSTLSTEIGSGNHNGSSGFGGGSAPTITERDSTSPVGDIVITNNEGGTGQIVVTKDDGSHYPAGTEVVITVPGDPDDRTIRVVLDGDGAGTIPAGEMPSDDTVVSAVVTEPGNNPSARVNDITLPGTDTATPDEGSLNVVRNPNGTGTITPTKSTGGSYPEGTTIAIGGIGTVTIGADGSATIPADDMPRYDVNTTATITEPNRTPVSNLPLQIPGSTSVAPGKVEVERELDGSGTISVELPGGGRYPAGTVVVIPGVGEFSLDADGNATIPADRMPDYDSTLNARVIEDGKNPSDTNSVFIEGNKTPRIGDVTIVRNPDGTGTIVVTNENGAPYPDGTIANIPGIGPITLDDEGYGTISADDMPLYDTTQSVTVTQPDRATSDPANVVMPGTKTTAPDRIEVIHHDDGSVTIIPIKPDDSRYPEGTVVDIPGIGEITLDGRGEGHIPSNQLPQNAGDLQVTIREPGKDASNTTSLRLPIRGSRPGVPSTGVGPASHALTIVGSIVGSALAALGARRAYVALRNRA